MDWLQERSASAQLSLLSGWTELFPSFVAFFLQVTELGTVPLALGMFPSPAVPPVPFLPVTAPTHSAHPHWKMLLDLLSHSPTSETSPNPSSRGAVLSCGRCRRRKGLVWCMKRSGKGLCCPSALPAVADSPGCHFGCCHSSQIFPVSTGFSPAPVRGSAAPTTALGTSLTPALPGKRLRGAHCSSGTWLVSPTVPPGAGQ